jgi:hypothetical protein
MNFKQLRDMLNTEGEKIQALQAEKGKDKQEILDLNAQLLIYKDQL